jgi:hypothetical protein
MNKTIFTRMFAHTGNILVIAGLVLVAVELQQNREMMRAQIRNELGQEVINVMGLAAGNKERKSLCAPTRERRLRRPNG